MSLAIRWWRNWRTIQLLPRDGPMSQQDNIVVEAIRACEEELAAVNAEAEAELQRELVKKGQG